MQHTAEMLLLPAVHIPKVLSHKRQNRDGSRNTFRKHELSRLASVGANEQQATTACVEGELVHLPATHRRGILQGMLGTAAMTITSPAAEAAAAQQPAATADPAQQQSSSTGSSSSESLGNAEACNGSARGAAAARDPTINSGCATPASVRQQQQMSGLVPPRQVGLDVEVLRAQAALDGCSTDLEKHRLLVTLKETNAAAFAALLQGDLEVLLPLVYTPTIGAACLAWGRLLPRPTGLYITSADRGKVDQVLQHWPSDEVRIAVVTDGERILGLGDLGAHGMGIPTGKCVVYSAAGAAPSWLLPITVDVGTNNAALLADPLYIGQPQQRLRGQPYQALMLEVVQGLQRRFGRQVLLHWEDLAVRNAFSVLQLSQGAGVPTFNDDIQATAAVAVAAVLGGVRVPGVLPLAQQRWLFFGAGQANLGTARLLVQALQQQGLSAAAAKARIWMVDSKGLLLNTRQDLTPEKAEFAQSPSNLPGSAAAAAAARLVQSSSSSSGSSRSSNSQDTTQRLASIVAAVQPTALIGAAAVQGAFDQPVIAAVTQAAAAAGGPSARPLVLALSNPNSKAECSFEDALHWSGGRAVFASGSPWPAVTVQQAGSSAASFSSIDSSSSSSSDSAYVSSSSSSSGVLLRPAQANNCLVFPGLGLGAVQAGAAAVTDGMLLAAAQAVAGMVTAEELRQECVLPRIGRLQEVTQAVAAAVAAAAPAGGGGFLLAA